MDEEQAKSTRLEAPDPSNRLAAQLLSNPTHLASLRRRHAFLNEYSDELLASTPIETLIKLETTSIKLKNMEKAKDVEDKLSNNRDRLGETEYWVEPGVDNRLSKLHEARFLAGAGCSAKKLWARGREVLGGNKHEAIATYDMHSIGLAGHVTAKGWLEIHDPGSSNLQLNLFSINNCGKRVQSTSHSLGLEELNEISELGELKTALRVLREAMAYVHPWNKSISAIEGFLVQTNYCSSDLEGIDRQGLLLCQFIDYVLRENSNRWKGQEEFLTTGDLRTTWESFFGARPQSALSKSRKVLMQNKTQLPRQQLPLQKQTGNGVGGLNVLQAMYYEDICVNFNMGRCLKNPGSCTTKKGRPLRHVCNYRPDPAQPAAYCGANHAACYFH